MDINIIDKKKGRLVFELPGSTHTLCNVLRHEMWNEKGVKTVSYIIDHPLVGVPRFTIETDGTDPKKVVALACAKLKKQFTNLSNEFKKEVK